MVSPKRFNDEWYGIPLKFVDKKTGELLTPVFKFEDAMGVWHEKKLSDCTWGELYNYSVAIWNVAMYLEHKKQKPKWAWLMLSLFLLAYCIYMTFS